MEELEGSEITEGLVRAHGVVGLFPVLEFSIEFGDGKRKGGDLIELLGMSAVGAFDPDVEFGGAGRQDRELDAALQASLLEDGGELSSAIDLQRPQGKRQTTLKGIEEQLGGRGGGPAVDFDHVPARDRIARGELLQHHAGRGPQVHGVELNQVPGPFHRIIFGLAQRPRAVLSPPPPLHPEHSGLSQHSPLAKRGQNPSHHRDRHRPALPLQQHRQFVLAPARIPLPQNTNPFGLLPRPSRLPPMERAVRTILQAAQVSGIVARFPAIERLPADPEMATRQSHIPPVGVILIEPGQPLASLPAQLGRAPLQVPGAGHSYPFNLHRDTLYRVSTIILNEYTPEARTREGGTRGHKRRPDDC